MIKKFSARTLIIFSLILLFNPSINLIDILPDCIGYAVLVLVIGKLSETIPYLSECKSALMKLTLVTLVKIPAFVIMYANIKYGSDIVPLFTLSFAVIELILIWSAVKNLFSALSYIGERTDCTSVREPLRINKKNSLTPEMLERITIVFFIVRAALNVLPELMLLTKDNFVQKREMMESYPSVLILAFLASLVISVVWLKYAIKYVKAISSYRDLKEAISYIESSSHHDISASEHTLKRLVDSLNVFAISSIFIFEISFQNLSSHNILPHFIYGLVLFCAIYNMTDNKNQKTMITAFSLCFILSAMINQSLMSRFFGMYQYVDLSYSKYAKAAYLPIKISAVLETVFMIMMLVVSTLILIRFIKENTNVSPSDPTYTTSDKRSHKQLIRMTVPLMVISGVISVLKCVNVFLKAYVKILPSDANDSGIVSSSVPGMNTFIFLICIAFVIYSFAAVSTLKEEVRFKYKS